MPSSYQPVSVTPSDSGNLNTQYSLEDVGAANYCVKRDWRRFQDAEQRREGDMLFRPNLSVPLGSQPFPEGGSGAPITLVHTARRGDGEYALIVGTQTTLYRYFSFDDGGVYTDDVYEVGVYEDLSGNWLKIGDNFSTNGSRWEAVDVAGLTYFNNGYDLPVSYNLGDLSVTPMFELREQGIAAVGTIEQFNGMLFCADISNMTAAYLTATMLGTNSGSVTATQSGNTVVASASFFTAAMLGQTITWDNGASAKILNVGSQTVVTVDRTQVQGAEFFNVALLYGAATDQTQISRVRYQRINSNIGDGRQFGAVGTGAIQAGSDVFILTQPIYSIKVGDLVTITGAGIDGSSYNATVTVIDNAFHAAFVVDIPAVVTNNNSTIQNAAYPTAPIGSTDLQDDGSAILRMVELQGRLLTFKETSIFITTFTGDNTVPFNDQRLYSGPNSLYWKWMLSKIDGTTVLYATQKDFFTIDLSILLPRKHPKLRLCSNLFYGTVTSPAQSDLCYATTNELTRELWLVYPSSGPDYGLCYDYEFDTCSTLGFPYSAGATVNEPSPTELSTPNRIFVLGTATGTILKYGLDNFTGSTFTRQAANYDSTISGGFVAFNDEFNEKDLRSYVAFCRGSAPFNVTLYAARNAHEAKIQIAFLTVPSPTYKTLLNVFARNLYFQDQIVVTGTPSPCNLVRRLFETSKVDSRSITKNPAT